jgi:transposase IS66 family protein
MKFLVIPLLALPLFGVGPATQIYLVELNPQDQTAIAIVAQINELFALDAQAREQGLNQANRQLLRLEKSKSLLEAIKSQIQAARTSALPKSVLAKACNYRLTLWTRLTRFLELRPAD